jgi:hypothetical protein
MGESYVMVCHGSTVPSARNIMSGGVSKRLYVTTDSQLAADYATFRAAEESAQGAVVAFTVPRALFQQWLADGSAHAKQQVEPFHCYVLLEPAWKQLHAVSAQIWTFSASKKMALYVAA